MESRHRHIFLMRVLAMLLASSTLVFAWPALAAEPGDDADAGMIPQVDRRDVKLADINASNFEVGISGGLLQIEDFGASGLVVGRLAYHVTEDLFVEARLGHARAGTTSFENLSGSATLLTDSQRNFDFYDVSLGVNLLPGEAFLGNRFAVNSAFYVAAGVGSTRFAGDSKFTFNAGMGYHLVVGDIVAADFQVRDHLFETSVTGEQKTTHNLEASIGLSVYF